uniref:protein-serine/threonine phosphatase n=1 Tax=Saimiri boliviensis boliviensis TaxID=39432 RepID=A0A2K6V4T0_SAIBB
MTCILVCFTGAPGPSEEAIRRELALDAALGRRIAELCASAQELPSLNTVFRTLALEDIPDLPPGGGLDCKRSRMGLGSPPPWIWALPWTWRPDSCCPLGILCSTGASTELEKKTDPFPSHMYQRKEGRPV